MLSNAQNIQNIEDAVRIVCQTIEKNTQDKIPLGGVNHIGRFETGHRIIRTERNLRYYFVFHRDHFRTFGVQFNEQGMKGRGESINLDALEKAIKLDCEGILFVYPNGYVYFVSKEEMAVYAKEFNLIRDTNATGERTVSLPIKVEKRWK